MTSKNPPAIAAWILQHLVPGSGDEALTGDLLEEFRSGRSTAWYWRQVLVAIAVGFSRELRTHWPALPLALLLSVPVPVFQVDLVRKLAEGLVVSRVWHLAWPYSTICDQAFYTACDLLYIWAGLVVCFLISSLVTRSLRVRRLARSLWVSLLTYVVVCAGVLALVLLIPLFQHAIDVRQMTTWELIIDVRLLMSRLPFVLTLLVSLWGLLPRTASNTATAAA